MGDFLLMWMEGTSDFVTIKKCFFYVIKDEGFITDISLKMDGLQFADQFPLFVPSKIHFHEDSDLLVSAPQDKQKIDFLLGQGQKPRPIYLSSTPKKKNGFLLLQLGGGEQNGSTDSSSSPSPISLGKSTLILWLKKVCFFLIT